MTTPTDELVDRFAAVLKEKLNESRSKNNCFDEDWQYVDWEKACQFLLMKHIEKGDPIEVAAYCAFLWYHSWPTVEKE